MSFNEIKEKIEWRKRALEYEISYVIENWNKMIYIHDEEVKNIAEYNLLNDIINPPKRAKYINIHYSPILHRSMNTRNGIVKLKNFRIILYSGFS